MPGEGFIISGVAPYPHSLIPDFKLSVHAAVDPMYGLPSQRWIPLPHSGTTLNTLLPALPNTTPCCSSAPPGHSEEELPAEFKLFLPIQKQ